MFNSVAFDVVINMVFIYLLYSLLATILGEMISSWFGIRSNILQRAIERMLTDGDDSDVETRSFLFKILFLIGQEAVDFWKWLKGLFLKKKNPPKNSLADKFYEYPAIKYLTEGKKILRSDKPSYISRDVFAQTLVHLMRDKGNGNSDAEKIVFCLKYNTLGIQPKTLKHLKNLFDDSNNDAAVFSDKLKDWFDETMYRTTGWFKRKMRGILFGVGLLIAISLNVDSIKIAHLVSRDNRARDKLVELAIAAAKDSSHFKLSLADTAMGRTLIDSSLALVKTDISQADSVMGLGWKLPSFSIVDTFKGYLPPAVASCNVLDTIYKFNGAIDTLKNKLQLKWGNVDSMKTRLQTMETARCDDIKFVNNALKTDFTAVDGYYLKKTVQGVSATPQISMDTQNFKFESKFPSALKRFRVLESIRANDSSIDSLSMMIVLGRGDIEKTKKELAAITQTRSSGVAFVNRCFSTKFISIDAFSYNPVKDPRTIRISGKIESDHISSATGVAQDTCVIYGKKNKGFIDKTWRAAGFVFVQSLPNKLRFWGFFITALMISCGAPFWFGLLQKLLVLRGAGVKPQEMEPDDENAPPKQPTNPPNPQAAVAVQSPPPANAVKKKTPLEESKNMVETAMRIYGDDLKNEKNVISVFQGYYKDQKTSDVKACIQVNVKDADTAVKIRDKYRQLRVGEKEFVELNVMATGEPRLRAANVDQFKNPKQAIANKTLVNGWGSYGCLVKMPSDDTIYLLSCFHVMNGSLNWDTGGDMRTIINKSGSIASDYRGYLNRYLDMAIAEVDKDVAEVYRKLQKSPSSVQEISESHVLAKSLTIHGAVSGVTTGIIIHNSQPNTFYYPLRNKEKKPHQLEDLIVVSHTNPDGSLNAITQGGDSGALVVDEAENAVGIVVAGDYQHTYVIKMTNILSALHMELI